MTKKKIFSQIADLLKVQINIILVDRFCHDKLIYLQV